MSSCYEQMKPYVQWAAQLQLMDPNRYVVGIAIAGMKSTGEIINIQGHMDVSHAKFSMDNSRFIVQLRGIGQRHVHAQHLGTSSTGDDAPMGDSPVIVQVDATEKEIRVRIGDKLARVVVDDFLLDCYNDSLLGISEEIVYIVSLQRLERSGESWNFVSAEQAAALGVPAVVAVESAIPAEPAPPADSEAPAETAAAVGDAAPIEPAALVGAAVLVDVATPAEPDAPAEIEAAAELDAEVEALLEADAPAEEVIVVEAVAAPEADDLQRLEGVGPGTEAALNSIGVTTYAQLAAYDPRQLEADLTAAGEKLIPGSLIAAPAQAALAAAGRWNALKYIQDELLKSGRPALPDDLTKINGIGPSTVLWLDALGITTFKQLRDANPDETERELKSAGLRIPMGSVSVWQEQASLAADNRWDDLAKLQGELAYLNDLMRVPEDETLS